MTMATTVELSAEIKVEEPCHVTGRQCDWTDCCWDSDTCGEMYCRDCCRPRDFSERWPEDE